MLLEFWERLRGYDKWIETAATINSSDLAEVEIGKARMTRFSDWEPIDEWQSKCQLAWTDASRASHTATYAVAEDSPLFQLYDGQTVAIRYNPARPDQFYLRGVLGSKVRTGIKKTFYFIARWFATE